MVQLLQRCGDVLWQTAPTRHQRQPPEEELEERGSGGLPPHRGLGNTPHPAPHHHPGPQGTLEPDPKPVSQQKAGEDREDLLPPPKPRTSADPRGPSNGGSGTQGGVPGVGKAKGWVMESGQADGGRQRRGPHEDRGPPTGAGRAAWAPWERAGARGWRTRGQAACRREGGSGAGGTARLGGPGGRNRDQSATRVKFSTCPCEGHTSESSSRGAGQRTLWPAPPPQPHCPSDSTLGPEATLGATAFSKHVPKTQHRALGLRASSLHRRLGLPTSTCSPPSRVAFQSKLTPQRLGAGPLRRHLPACQNSGRGEKGEGGRGAWSPGEAPGRAGPEQGSPSGWGRGRGRGGGRA